VNKRKRKKKLSKKSHIIGIDLSTQPDMTVYIPASVLEKIYKGIEPQLNKNGFFDKLENIILNGTSTNKPKGMIKEESD
jgi:hypothetical protein